MENIIEVIIPSQKYDAYKYVSAGQKCYLEEALENLGYKNACVLGLGHTIIDKHNYLPSSETPFDLRIVKESFADGRDIHVKLILQNS